MGKICKKNKDRIDKIIDNFLNFSEELDDMPNYKDTYPVEIINYNDKNGKNYTNDKFMFDHLIDK